MKRRNIFSVLILLVILGSGFLAGRVSAAQPHMVGALDHLRMARHELDEAQADKGGHRVRALKLVNDAIAEVERGIEAGRH